MGALQNWQGTWLRVRHSSVSVHWLGRTGRDKKEQSGKWGPRELGGEIQRGSPGAWLGRLPGPFLLVLGGDLLSSSAQELGVWSET